MDHLLYSHFLSFSWQKMSERGTSSSLTKMMMEEGFLSSLFFLSKNYTLHQLPLQENVPFYRIEEKTKGKKGFRGDVPNTVTHQVYTLFSMNY